MQEKSSRAWLPAASHAAVLALGILVGMRFGPSDPGPTPEPTAPSRNPDARPSDPAASVSRQDQRSARESRATGIGPRPASPAGHFEIHANGILVPPYFASRMSINLMDSPGEINREGLAEFGLTETDALRLENLVAEAKAAEKEREIRSARILRDDENQTLIWIPPGEKDTRREEAWNSALDAAFGSHDSVVAGWFSTLEWVTGGWGTQSKIIVARPEEDGTTSYNIHYYDPDNPPEIGPDLEVPTGSSSTTTRSETVPDQIRHLFE